jgi:hypothetical protein
VVQVKDLTELNLENLWREVKDEEGWWGDFEQETLRVAKRLLESVMVEELIEQLRAGRYRRTDPSKKDGDIAMAIGIVICLPKWA